MKITDFNNREDLENHIINVHGKTPDIKDDKIEGTQKEFRKFNLRHGQFVWGVKLNATDYEQKRTKSELSRGEVKRSVINGLINKKNAHKSKIGK